MPVRLRRAEEADIPFLAGVAIAAARSHVERGLFDLLIPDDADARQAFAEALLRARPSWCHWQNFHLAEVDGEATGARARTPASASASASASVVVAGTTAVVAVAPAVAGTCTSRY